jgi:hypothetical protein
VTNPNQLGGLLIDPYGNPVPGTEALAAFYLADPDIAGGTYGGPLPVFNPAYTDPAQYDPPGKEAAYVSEDVPQLDQYTAALPGTGASTFIGTDFGSFLGGIEPMANYSVPDYGGVDFPSLRDIIVGVGGEVLNAFQDPGVLSYTAQAPSAPLLGGACPPGRVLRRVSLGRDKCVKKPHMNVCNRHALARSTRRVSGFLTMAKNTEKKMRQSFGGLLTTKKRASSSTRGGRCGGCGQTQNRCAC